MTASGAEVQNGEPQGGQIEADCRGAATSLPKTQEPRKLHSSRCDRGTGHLSTTWPGEGCMSDESEQLNRTFEGSRSRLAYLNIGLAAVLVLAGVIEICIMLLRE